MMTRRFASVVPCLFSLTLLTACGGATQTDDGSSEPGSPLPPPQVVPVPAKTISGDGPAPSPGAGRSLDDFTTDVVPRSPDAGTSHE